MNDKKMAKDLFGEGIAAFTRGRCDMSISNFSSAIQLDPEFELAYLSRGVVYAKTDKIDLALADFDKAIELNPKHGYHLRGLVHLKLGDRAKAIDDFNKAIELNPKYGVAYYSRGTAHSELGNMERAGKDMVMAARLGEANLQGFADEHNILRTRYDKCVAEVLGERERDWLMTPDFKSWLETETLEEAA